MCRTCMHVYFHSQRSNSCILLLLSHYTRHSVSSGASTVQLRLSLLGPTGRGIPPLERVLGPSGRHAALCSFSDFGLRNVSDYVPCACPLPSQRSDRRAALQSQKVDDPSLNFVCQNGAAGQALCSSPMECVKKIANIVHIASCVTTCGANDCTGIVHFHLQQSKSQAFCRWHCLAVIALRSPPR